MIGTSDSPIFHVITLKDHPERSEYTKKLLTDNNLKYRMFAFKKQSIPWKGCLNSHIQIYKYAHKKKMEFVFIMEDNVCLSANANPKENLKEVMQIAKSKDDWDTIILGGFITPWSSCSVTEYRHLFKTSSVHGTSCYVIHRRLFDKVITKDKLKIDRPIDIYLSSLRQYIYKPMIFHHRIIKSVINNRLDNIRKFWFSPGMYKLTEMWFFDGKLKLVVVLSFAIILMICSVLIYGIITCVKI